jgi:hypothetical protein
LIEDERHLTARTLYHSIQERLGTAESNSSNSPKSVAAPRRFHFRPLKPKRKGDDTEHEDHEKAREILEQHKEILDDLEVGIGVVWVDLVVQTAHVHVLFPSFTCSTGVDCLKRRNKI